MCSDLHFACAGRRGLLATCIAVGLLLHLTGARAGAPAGATCSDASLSGNYGFAGTGLLRVDASLQPLALIGVASFDGHGRGEGRVWLDTGSSSLSAELPALNYAVMADCSGFVAAPGGLSAAITIPDRGRALPLKETDDLGNLTGAAWPVEGLCGNQSLRGEYSAVIDAPDVGAPPLVGVPLELPARGKITLVFDGAGDVIETRSADLLALPISVGGHYSVTESCTGWLTLRGSDDREFTAPMIVVGGGDGAAIAGSLPDTAGLLTLSRLKAAPGR